MARIKMIPEIFEVASGLKTKEERITYLRQNQSELMRYIVQGALHPGVEWLLPTGIPPHIPAPTRDTEGILYKEIGRLYIFCKGGHPTLKQYQREKLFVDLLSVLHPSDVQLLCAVKEKRIPYPFLTYDLFKEAFPTWLPEKEPEKKIEISIPKTNETISVSQKKEEIIEEKKIPTEAELLRRKRQSEALKASWALKKSQKTL